MPDSLFIKNGRVIDPSQGLDQIADMLIEDGKIAAIQPAAPKPSPQPSPNGRGSDESPIRNPQSAIPQQVIDASNKIVSPGLIDIHVHLREPGKEEAETIATGAAAAVAGGFTAVACMPNTQPALDNEAMIEFVYRQAKRAGLCRVYPIGAITKGREGKELAEMGQMVRAGAVAFSDDGRGVASPMVMFRAMQYAAMFDKLIIQHCEDAAMAEGGCMNSGATAARLGLPGIPAMAEEMMIQRDLLIAENTKARYHVAHISTAGAVQMVRQAKARKIPVTTEVCPHHLLMTEDLVDTFDTNYKMNPPLRTQRDVEACIAAVIDGTIDCLITDHAPHDRADKELDFQSAPFGIIGLEVALGLFIKALITPGHLDWPGLIARMSTNPARITGIPGGTLKIGSPADVTIIDPDLEWTVDSSAFASNSRNAPYDGWILKGKSIYTIVGGRIKSDSRIAFASLPPG